VHEHDGLTAPFLPLGQTPSIKLERVHRSTVTGERIALQSPGAAPATPDPPPRSPGAVAQAAPPFGVDASVFRSGFNPATS
jgi:hypothetical protein